MHKVSLGRHLRPVDSAVPKEAANKPLLAMEAYLEQIDSASGTGTVLDDTYPSDLHVTH